MDKTLREAIRILSANPALIKEFDIEVRKRLKKGLKQKIVINSCFGGFSLSDEAVDWLDDNGHPNPTKRDFERNDPLLVKCVETLGEKANGSCAHLTIIEIPDGVDFRITEYDGSESVEF